MGRTDEVRFVFVHCVCIILACEWPAGPGPAGLEGDGIDRTGAGVSVVIKCSCD